MSEELTTLFQQGYRYAFSLTHNPASAEDLLQDAWLSMLKINAPIVKSYLLKTIRNHFLNKNRRERLVPIIAIDETLDDHILIDNEADRSQLIANQDMLNKALSQLRTIEREVIFLFYIEEYSTMEITELTSLSKGQVCSLIHRSRDKLKNILEVEAEFNAPKAAK